MPKTSQPAALLTSLEVEEILGISRATVQRLVSGGTLRPAQKLPGLRGAHLFDANEVERVRRARTTSTP